MCVVVTHLFAQLPVTESAMNNPLQLTIPAVDTTYWCSVFRLPQEVRQQERYVFKVTLKDCYYV